MARVGFWQLFQSNPDGSIEPLKTIKIAGVQLGPGAKFSQGVLFSGVDLHQYKGLDLEVVEQTDGSTLITGYYK